MTNIIKGICALFFLIFSNNLFSQDFQVFGGVNYNNFYEFPNQYEGHYRSSYKSASGFTCGVSADNIKYERLKYRFSLQFDVYSGDLMASDGGLGGGYTTIASIKKSVLSIGIFPFNTVIAEKIDLNLGVLLTALLSEKYDGTVSNWSINYPSSISNINDKYNKYSSSLYAGLQGRIAYNLQLKNGLTLTPQYLYYFGLSHEFDEFPDRTKSQRHYLCIGIKKKL